MYIMQAAYLCTSDSVGRAPPNNPHCKSSGDCSADFSPWVLWQDKDGGRNPHYFYSGDSSGFVRLARGTRWPNISALGTKALKRRFDSSPAMNEASIS